MNIKKLSRQDKEKMYIEKMTRLQLHWKNPIDDDWDLSDWTNDELDKGLGDTIGQLRFEMFFKRITNVISLFFYGFVALGIIGLLLFGIRQIF